MRTLMGLILLAAIAAAAYYGWQRFMGTSGPRACARLGERCRFPEQLVDACTRLVAEVHDGAGAEAAQKLVKCINDSDGCVEAAGCVSVVEEGLLSSRAVFELLEGLRHPH